jgi:phytoene dehydrogenase-like protein
MSTSADVLIIGAGLAGLCCAKRLAEAGITFEIVEGSDGIGGRVRTDEVDGFLLDRGFQVLLTAILKRTRFWITPGLISKLSPLEHCPGLPDA